MLVAFELLEVMRVGFGVGLEVGGALVGLNVERPEQRLSQRAAGQRQQRGVKA